MNGGGDGGETYEATIHAEHDEGEIAALQRRVGVGAAAAAEATIAEGLDGLANALANVVRDGGIAVEDAADGAERHGGCDRNVFDSNRHLIR